MSMHAFPTDDKTDWLTDAILQVNKLPDFNKVDRARNETARKLLCSIEALHIVPPIIKRAASGGVYIRFGFGVRTVEFFVSHPNIITIQRISPYESGYSQAVHGWPGQLAREAIAWVFPAANQATEANMVAETERVAR